MPQSSVTIEYRVANQGFNDAIKGMKDEVKTLNKEFALQKEQMQLTGTETEKLMAKTEKLRKELKLADDVVTQSENGLKNARDTFGENAKATKEWADRLLDAKKNQAYLQNEITTTEKKVEKLTGVIKEMDDSNAPKNLKNDISQIKEEVQGADNSFGDFSEGFKNLLAGGAIGGIISGVKDVGQAIIDAANEAKELSLRKTSINIAMDFDEDGIRQVDEASKKIEAFGIDAGEALSGVKLQWNLNRDATEEANEKVVEGAAAISSAYSGIDFKELIQETNEISNTLKITNEDALGLVLALLKVGFPEGQLDIISEYGTQLALAGYSAEEIQAIFEAGLDTGTWNIDNLLDGVKEGRIRISEFAKGVPEDMVPVIESMGFTTDEFVRLAQQVKSGGDEGKLAFDTIATAITNMGDTRAQDEAGLALYGTKWEDQGTKITNAITGAEDKVISMKENTDKLAEATAAMNDDPAVQFEQAMQRFEAASLPVKIGVLDLATAILGLVTPTQTYAGEVESFYDKTSVAAAEGSKITIDALTGTVTKLDDVTGEVTVMTYEQYKAWKENNELTASDSLSTYNLINETIKEKMERMNTTTEEKGGEIAATLDEKFSDGKDNAEKNLNAIDASAAEIMAGAKRTVDDELDAMATSAGGMSWHIAAPAVPKFSWSGAWDYLTGTVPEIITTWATSWFANGGYAPNTTLIGMGEAGAEGIVPLEGRHMMPFADAVADRMVELQGISNENSTIININATLNGTQDYELLGRTIDKHLNRQSHEVKLTKGR